MKAGVQKERPKRAKQSMLLVSFWPQERTKKYTHTCTGESPNNMFRVPTEKEQGKKKAREKKKQEKNSLFKKEHYILSFTSSTIYTHKHSEQPSMLTMVRTNIIQ